MLRRAITLTALAALLGGGASAAVAAHHPHPAAAAARADGRPARDLVPVSQVRAIRVVIRTEYVRAALNHDGPPFFLHGSGAARLAAFVNRIHPVDAGDNPLCSSTPKRQHARMGFRITVRFLGAHGQRLARARLHKRNCMAFIRLRVNGFRGPVLEDGVRGEGFIAVLRRLGVPGIPQAAPDL